MDDQIHSLFDPARFVKAMADIEHDDPEQVPTFRRDQNLKPTFTDAMLFKQKVLAVLIGDLRCAEAMQASEYARGACSALRAAINVVEGVQP